MSVLDLSLVKAPLGGTSAHTLPGTGRNAPATIDGWPFEIDPSTVELPMSAKVQKYRTIGGFVVQVYGTTWGDLTVSGQFGAGGWRSQQRFLDKMVQIAGNQAIQREPTFSGQNFTPSQPFQFSYPLLGWKFLCYLKDYTSPDGPLAVHVENTNINPKWTLTLFIVTDNGTLSKPAAIQSYLQRLAPGLGYMWDAKAKPGQDPWQGYQQDQYNAPLNASDLQGYINDPKGTGHDVVAAKGAAATTGAGSGAGTTGKSYDTPNAKNIKTPSDFSNCLLAALKIVPGDLDIGSPQADNDVLVLNAQQAQEGQWSPKGGPTSDFYAGNMHNPLNINSPSGFGYGYKYGIDGQGGTGSFPTWADGVSATADNLANGYSEAIAGLKEGNARVYTNGLVLGGWAGESYGNDVMGRYHDMGGKDA